MILIAPRRTLTFAAVGLVVLALAVQWALGFRLGSAAGAATEVLAWLLYAGAVLLLVVPLGRARALIVGALGFMLMAWAVHLNARFSTTLLSEYVGGLVNARVMIATILYGPALGLIVGITAGLLARFELIRWTPKSPVS